MHLVQKRCPPALSQPDGTLACSPFHVRFGKLQLLKPHEKVVSIAVNDAPVDLSMRLGYSGEAYFVDMHDTNQSISGSVDVSATTSACNSPVPGPQAPDRLSASPDATFKLEASESEVAQPRPLKHLDGTASAESHEASPQIGVPHFNRIAAYTSD